MIFGGWGPLATYLWANDYSMEKYLYVRVGTLVTMSIRDIKTINKIFFYNGPVHKALHESNNAIFE